MGRVAKCFERGEVGPLIGLRFKFGEMKNLSSEASELILETKCMGWEKEIPKEETYSAKIEIEAIEKHGTFVRIPFGQIPIGESLIEGIFVYAIKNKPLSAGYGKTGAYLDEKQKTWRDLLRERFLGSSWG